MSENVKARFWSGILYPENMRDDWEDSISELLQIPYCYCIHDKDLLKESEEERKVHVHLIICFSNTTTFKTAMRTFHKLDKNALCSCLSTCEYIQNIRYMYNYLIHDTDKAKKDKKFQYPLSSRKFGNNFDIGSYEQLDISDRDRMLNELLDCVISENFTNFSDFYMFFKSNYDSSYFQVLKGHSGLIERIIKGNYLKLRSSL